MGKASRLVVRLDRARVMLTTLAALALVALIIANRGRIGAGFYLVAFALAACL